MPIARIRTILTGWSGSPGLHTTYWQGVGITPTQGEVNDAGARVRAFWAAMSANHLSPFQAAVQPNVDIISEVTGDLTGGLSVNPTPAIVTGTGTGELYSPGVMALLKSDTGQIRAGRRVQGRSFIGPITEAVAVSGQIGSVGSALITTASNLLLAVTPTVVKPVVWARPRIGVVGVAYPVVGYSVPAKLAWLSSRRD